MGYSASAVATQRHTAMNTSVTAFMEVHFTPRALVPTMGLKHRIGLQLYVHWISGSSVLLFLLVSNWLNWRIWAMWDVLLSMLQDLACLGMCRRPLASCSQWSGAKVECNNVTVLFYSMLSGRKDRRHRAALSLITSCSGLSQQVNNC